MTWQRSSPVPRCRSGRSWVRPYPLNLEGNRELNPDFDAVVMEGCGHYPMLERPAEFNQHLLAYLEEFENP